MRLASGFEVSRSGNLDYEEMTGLIMFKGDLVAEILQENGPNQLEIDLLPGTKNDLRYGRLPLMEFLNAIEVAKFVLGLRDELPDGVDVVGP